MSGKGEALEAVRWIGPATAEVLADTGVTAAAVAERRVSFRQLTAHGVNPGVAAKLRREHSLPWSFDSSDGEDLRRRSAQVRGLGDEERAWVAASSDGWDSSADPTVPEPAADGAATDGPATDESSRTDREPAAGWTPGGWPGQDEAATAGVAADAVEADGSGDPVAAESAWRERSEPTPVTDLDGLDEVEAALLADAGIVSVRSLANVDPGRVATLLDIPASRIESWHEAACHRV